MIDYKYSFVITEIENNKYALVMSCWYNNDDGSRVDVKSDSQINLTLDQCLELTKGFIIVE
jgi:hypothetical protein